MSLVIAQAYPGGVVNNAVLTTNQIFPVPTSLSLPTGGTTAAVCTVPGSGKLNGRYWYVSCCGFLTASASMNVTPVLYSGTSITPGSNTIIATGTAFATGGAGNFPFACFYDFQGDSLSGFLQSWQQQQFNNTYVAPTAAGVTKLTGLNFNTSDPVLSLVFGLTFSVAGANSATLSQFTLEA